MDFSEQIKSIRKKENLTQEQFALSLNVTRQAVSNWENNKNLPDIEMLIRISDIYHISLDELIKGDNMNNIKEKIIKDGSENQRSKYNMVTSLIGGMLLLMGIMMIIIKGLSVEYIDEYGFLHENFFLLPLGFLCIFSGFICFTGIGIRTVINRMKNRYLSED